MFMYNIKTRKPEDGELVLVKIKSPYSELLPFTYQAVRARCYNNNIVIFESDVWGYREDEIESWISLDEFDSLVKIID